LRARWARRLDNGGRRRIGIVWSVKLGSDGEHPSAKREIPLDQFLDLLGARNTQLYSLQTQEREQADARGIHAFEFDDFADVAALASLMDGIVSVDTAAAHLCGAIGHPNVSVLLPYAATWRWLHGDWYPQMKLCKQTSPGDWASAFGG
jgi:ADP-heptose:LPS heptosyltransferase